MDGVLLLSSSIHDEAYREALAPFALSRFDYSEIAGRRTDEALRYVFSDNGIECTDEEVARISSLKSRLARQKLAEKKPIAAGAVPLLRTLAEAYPLALASSASEGTVDLFLKLSGLGDVFTAILNGADVPVAKPAPEIYLLACSRLSLAPSRCLVVEDAVSGVIAGKAAGAIVWGLSSDSAARDLRDAGADRVIGTLDELYELVGVATGGS